MSLTIADAQAFFLVMVRVLAVILVAPVLSSTRIPAPVKIGLAFFIAVALTPMQPRSEQPYSLWVLAYKTGQELLTGFMVGLASLLTFVGLQMAATFIGMQAGFRMGDIVNPNLADLIQQQGSALEQLYTLMVALLFLAIDGHHWLILGLQRTFELVPAGEFLLSDLALERLMALVASMFTTALSIALPVLGTLLLVSLALGVVARAVPQVQVFFVSLPLQLSLGIITLLLALPWMASLIVGALSRVLDDMLIFHVS